MVTCHTNCIQRPLSAAFYHLGQTIARHPYPFLLFPIVISLGLGLGFLKLSIVDDIEYLFTPTNAEARKEKSLVSTYFPVNYSGGFHPLRFENLRGYANIILTAKDGGDVLRPKILAEAMELDGYIKNGLTTNMTEGRKTFRDLCARWKDNCVDSTLLFSLLQYNPQNISKLHLTYPMFNTHYYLGQMLGGVVANSTTDAIKEARAMQLLYSLQFPTDQDRITQLTLQWLEEFLNKMADYSSEKISVSYSTTESIEKELETSTNEIIPFFAITFSVIITFTITLSMTSDWVISKPLLAFTGVLTAGMAILSTIGLISATGVHFISLLGVMPVLILGIGVDDTFVLLSAWRMTSRLDCVEKRMAKTFEEAALSVTLTSLTNIIAFCVGAITVFPSVQIFCLYTGVAIIFTYLYTISFFGACLALTGRREHANRHCYTFKKILPQSKTEERSNLFKIFCSGGYEQNLEHKEHSGTKVFRSYLAPWILSLWGKRIMLVVYLVYVAGSIYGCVQVKQGLKLSKLANDGSYLVKFYEDEEKYFNTYGLQVSFIVRGDLDYSALSIQNQIEELTKKFENTPYSFKNLTTSWLRQFTSAFHPDQSNFMQLLSTKFLTLPPFDRYSIDLDLDDEKQKIRASRYFVQTKYMASTNEQKDLMVHLRKIAEDSDLDVTVYHPGFVYYDQYIVILANTLQNIGIALAAMIVVSLLLIPQPLCSLWVMLSIVSIDAGVIGFMSLWKINLDFVSMINIILCIGFSIDFSAHITYSFVKSESETKRLKAIDSLTEMGFPMVQNALSSVLGLITLAFSRTYIFQTFFKTLLLAIIFGAFHGLIVLPIMLSFFGPGTHSTEIVASINRNNCEVNTKKKDIQNGIYILTTYPYSEIAIFNGDVTWLPPPDYD